MIAGVQVVLQVVADRRENAAASSRRARFAARSELGKELAQELARLGLFWF